MARGTQFSVLRTRLRAELKRSVQVSVGVEDVNTLNVTLNHAYTTLYLQKDWAHLRKIFTQALVAGSYRYDFPTGLNSDRVEVVEVKWNGIFTPVARGIDIADYNAHDSNDDERSDPVLKWDVRWVTDETQLEVWPIPASAQTLYLKGIQSIEQLVNDDDLCLLDDDLVVLFASAELAPKDQRETKLAIAQSHLNMLTARMRGGQSDYRLGLGPTEGKRPEIVVRVAG
jgi:hypothetical protein